MLKLLVVGLPMLCQSTTPDLIAGWKMDDKVSASVTGLVTVSRRCSAVLPVLPTSC